MKDAYGDRALSAVSLVMAALAAASTAMLKVYHKRLKGRRGIPAGEER
ncbi:MAG: hypothetical protein JW909_01495 [Planctomycetes bacterium]|nr:hypothetical protein [Planctomycetota bacterium]